MKNEFSCCTEVETSDIFFLSGSIIEKVYWIVMNSSFFNLIKLNRIEFRGNEENLAINLTLMKAFLWRNKSSWLTLPDIQFTELLLVLNLLKIIARIDEVRCFMGWKTFGRRWRRTIVIDFFVLKNLFHVQLMII